MKIDLESEDILAIAAKVVELLQPHLFRKEDQRTEGLLDADAVAAMLGTSKNQIYQWVHNSKHGLGDFPYEKAGKGLRFSEGDILKWTKKNGKALETR